MIIDVHPFFTSYKAGISTFNTGYFQGARQLINLQNIFCINSLGMILYHPTFIHIINFLQA